MSQLRAITNKIDPMGIFLDKEVNFDEYDPEIKDMLQLFLKCKDFEEFYDGVYISFINWFDEANAGEKSKYHKLSGEVYKYLKSIKNPKDIKKTYEELNKNIRP